TRHLGGERAAGGWAEYVAVDAVNAHRIPVGVSFSAASLAEPAAVCYESFKRANLQTNQDVLVIGDGPFGFLHAVIARILGAETIIVAGHYDERLERIVRDTGAVACNTHHHDVLDVVKEKTDGLGVNVVVDATGAGSAPNIGIAALKPRGTLVIFSLIWKPQVPDFGAISFKELTIVGSCRSLNCFDPCLAWMGEGKIPAEKLVDVQVPLAQVNDAIRQLTERKKDIFKAVLLPQVR
ncbi:MAG: zinc-binding dehydrogenase, partial [Sedimentisphaerales bacterium]|nr:zinc-binding dehydrogenase [Sedimentisphaerales bacterium]